MKIVTREEYINSLINIDLYHRQQNPDNKERIEIDFWIRTNNPSVRLKNILIELGWNFKYIDELDEIKFKTVRNAGLKTWTEFYDKINN